MPPPRESPFQQVGPCGSEDHQLMQRVVQGDVQAFETLYNKYKLPIRSYLYQMTGQKALAEELTQETFLRVFRHKDRYEAQARFSSWLWTIARNLALNHFEKKKEALLSDPGTAETTIEQIEEPLGDAEAMLLEKAALLQIQKCLEALPSTQKEAFQLRTLSDLSYEELGVALGLSLASVKSALHRAKQALLHCMKKAKP